MKTPAIPFIPLSFFLQMPGLLAGLVLSAALMLPPPAIAAGQVDNQVDNRIYATLLAQHVRKNRVDYEGFKRD